MHQVGILWRQSFLSRGLRLPNKLDLWRTPLAKKCCLVGKHVIFKNPWLKTSLYWRSVGCNVIPNWWRTHFVAYHIAPFPWNSWWTNAFIHCSLNWPYESRMFVPKKNIGGNSLIYCNIKHLDTWGAMPKHTLLLDTLVRLLNMTSMDNGRRRPQTTGWWWEIPKSQGRGWRFDS